MKKVVLFNVGPAIPAELGFLETLANNLWWCWNSDAIELFRRIDPRLWTQTGHNPIVFLNSLPQKKLQLKHLQKKLLLKHLAKLMVLPPPRVAPLWLLF